MSTSVSRQKCDALAFERSDDERVGRISERGSDFDFLNIGQLGHLIKPAAADDPHLHLRKTTHGKPLE